MFDRSLFFIEEKLDCFWNLCCMDTFYGFECVVSELCTQLVYLFKFFDLAVRNPARAHAHNLTCLL